MVWQSEIFSIQLVHFMGKTHCRTQAPGKLLKCKITVDPWSVRNLCEQKEEAKLGKIKEKQKMKDNHPNPNFSNSKSLIFFLI